MVHEPMSCRNIIIAFALAIPIASLAGLSANQDARAGTGAQTGDGGVSEFYRWDRPIPEEPGLMLRSEPLSERHRTTGASEQKRILYSSTSGISGDPVTVSGMLFIPEGDRPEGGWPLLAWAHGTTGVADVCAPSWRGLGRAVSAYLDAWLEEGYAVVATDYEGLGTPGLHPYLVKRAEAYSVLDSIRAALDARDDLAAEVVISGQSQGGGAAFASAAFAPEYAPELPIKGTIATGLPYLTADMPTASAMAPDEVDPGLAYVFYAAHVARMIAPDLDAARLFREPALGLFEEAADTCIGELMSKVRQAERTQANTLQPEAIATMTEILLPYYVYPTVGVDQPLFVATGTEDRDVDPRGQLLLVRDACAAGSVVQARLYAGEGHIGAWLASTEEAIAFARTVRAGDPVEPECAPVPVMSP